MAMPLKRNWFLSITIDTLFWCLWRWMALSCQKRLVFVCLAWPLLDLWTGSHIYSPLSRLFQGKWAPFIGPQRFLTPDTDTLVSVQIYHSAMYGVLFPYLLCCSKVLWAWSARSSAETCISLVGSGLSSGLQALSHRRDVASLSLFYKYYYGKYSSELADLIPPKHVTVRSRCRCIVIQLILLWAGLSFIN